MSLLVSWYVYDLSNLYKLSWLFPNNDNIKIVNIHAGFDETSVLLSAKFPNAELIVFDFYDQEILADFAGFIRTTTVPVLGICGGHQMIGLSFGARVVTLDLQEQSARRDDRVTEYQYRLVRIIQPDDPIFEEIDNPHNALWQDYTREGRILRVWQNHGLQLDQVPAGFQLLATSYLCRNQMMVKRSDGQMIYSVQFHLEKSFEDWNKSRTRWEHPNESRDGRILFESFLRLALAARTN